ncbi:hypothetical protein U9M48_042273 [Paspalum notatum var. saurae]|uniref:Uncharacterized protein n=1 Tax=Paspalum notatum var. saurae TaxID=547442 RepID=A0AAQ3XEB3_PASNO
MFIFIISRPFNIPSRAVIFMAEGPILTLSLPDGSLDGNRASMFPGGKVASSVAVEFTKEL